jgi:arylsulfatase A-like enzyme
MILLIVWDGLRPDMITPEQTPYLHRMAGEGVFCTASHAAFPTATRINSATITTGCYPGQHGIVDNGRYVPAIDPAKALNFANWTHLQQMADQEGQRLLSVATLGEILRANGKRMASAGSGSPGTTYLTNPTVSGPIANWALAWPAEAQAEIGRRCGPFPGPDSTTSDRTRFVLRAVEDYLVPEHQPDVLTLWITEPDHAQHAHGIGSPQALSTLAELDHQLEQFITALDPSGDQNTYLLLSDHGFSTIADRPDINGRLVAAGLKAAPKDRSILYDCDSVYLNGNGRDRFDDLVRFMAGEPWIGALLLRDDRMGAYPDAMPQSAAFGAHSRSAELMFAYRWWAEENKYGVPGCSASRSSNAATHGSASPYDVNSTLVAWGAGIKRGHISPVPCGNVDVAPTVLRLLDLPVADSMQGRVLSELLTGGPDPACIESTSTTREAIYRSANGPRCQTAHYSAVNGHRYLDQITWEA